MQPDPKARSRQGRDPSSAGAMPDGALIEARVAQVWFWEGFFARHDVDLWHHFEPEPLTVTDLDLLAFDFNPQLSRSKYIGEVKSGTGKSAAKPLDRLVWLRGLRELVQADSAELTIAHPPSDRVRAVARSLGLVAQSLQDFERREAEAVGKLADTGAHGVAALELTLKVRKTCHRDPELERAFWFLRSGVWFLDPFIALKQLIDLLRRMHRRWTPRHEDEDAQAIRWLVAESASILTLNLVTIAGFSLTYERLKFYDLVKERLAEGQIPAPEMRRLSESIDQYVAGVLRTIKAPASVMAETIGAFHPEPPEWAEPLAEVAWRLGRTPLAARSLPRQTDLLLFERVARRREVPESAANRLGLERPDTARLRNLLAAFLRGCQASSPMLDEAFVTAILTTQNTAQPSPASEPREQQSALFREA